MQAVDSVGSKKRKLEDAEAGAESHRAREGSGLGELAGLVDGGDVALVVAQYLYQLNCFQTLESLQHELGVRFNVLEGKSALLKDLKEFKFDLVLQRLNASKLTLRKETFALLHELVILDLCEKAEHEAAKKIFIASDALQHLKDTHQPRYKLLVQALQRKVKVSLKQERSGQLEALAEMLEEELIDARSGQLLRLVGDAIKWKKLRGAWPTEGGLVARYAIRLEESKRGLLGDGDSVSSDGILQKSYATVRFGKQAHAEVCAFAPNGRLLATGSTDGFIELWDPETGKLDVDLPYQKADELMMHSKSILCLRFSHDSTLLVTGCKKGLVKLWRISDGKCLAKFKRVHKDGVLAVDLSSTNDSVISGGADHTIKLLGVKSGNQLREYSGHTSYVNSLRYYDNDSKIVSASSDGTVRVWQSDTATCVKVVKNLAGSHLENFAVTKVLILANNEILLCRRADSLVRLGTDFEVKQRYTVKDASFTSITCAETSDVIYASTAEGKVYCFDKDSGQRKATFTVEEASQKEIVDMSIQSSGAKLAAATLAGPLVLFRST